MLNMSVSKTIDHIQINIKMPNPSEEPQVSSKVPNEDLKEIDVLCTSKIKTGYKNMDHGCIRDKQPYPNQDQDPNPSQDPPASPKAPNQD